MTDNIDVPHPSAETQQDRSDAYKSLAKCVRKLVFRYQETGGALLQAKAIGQLVRGRRDPEEILTAAMLRSPEGNLIMLQRVVVQYAGEKALSAALYHQADRHGPRTTYNRHDGAEVFVRNDYNPVAYGAPDPRDIGAIEDKEFARRLAESTKKYAEDQVCLEAAGLTSQPISAQEALQVKGVLLASEPDYSYTSLRH